MKSIWQSMKPYFVTKKEHPTRKQNQKEQYILLTYRSGIQKVYSSTYYTSDAGWGCMLRVGQMFIANLYYKYQGKSSIEIIRLFHDNSKVFFCLPMITDIATIIYPHKKQYQWFSPCQCGFVIKELMDRFDQKYRISICNDNCIFLNEIVQDREMLIIMAMCRIGLDQPQPQYLNCVLTLMKNPYFNSILGGTPKRAHLFLKHSEGYLGFLDPHQTRKVHPLQKIKQHQKQYLSKLQWIKEQYIDCSMAITFVVPQKQMQLFWQILQQTKKMLGQSFFIYLAKQRPVFDSDDLGIIEIYDDDYIQSQPQNQTPHHTPIQNKEQDIKQQNKTPNKNTQKQKGNKNQ